MEGQFRNAHQGECLCPFIEQIIRDNPPLSAEAERRLLETMPREFAEQQIVLHCLGYAASIARSQSIPGMTLEDTFQLIVMVMVKAVKRFDVSKCDPSMSFTGFAKRAIERQLMRLGDPAWGSNDAKMNLLTSTLGEYGAGEDGDVEDSLSRMIQAGKDIACENAWSDNALPPLGIDNLVHEFRKYRETLGYTAKRQGRVRDQDSRRQWVLRSFDSKSQPEPCARHDCQDANRTKLPRRVEVDAREVFNRAYRRKDGVLWNRPGMGVLQVGKDPRCGHANKKPTVCV